MDAVTQSSGGRIEKGKVYESMELVKLEPEDWFLLHEIKGHRLWIPPPAAMDTVLELTVRSSRAALRQVSRACSFHLALALWFSANPIPFIASLAFE